MANDRDEVGKATNIMGITQQTESRLEDESLESLDSTVNDDPTQQSDEPLSFESRKTEESKLEDNSSAALQKDMEAEGAAQQAVAGK